MTVFGFWGRYPEVREQPSVVAPVTEKDTTQEDFEIAVSRGTATEVPNVNYELDFVFYLDDGNSPPQYISRCKATERVAAWADEKVAKGDRLFLAGNQNLALAFYGIAAAVRQSPREYARMLLCSMPEAKTTRVEQILARVARLDPPSLHVDMAREEMGLQ